MRIVISGEFKRLGALATGAVFPGLCARRHVDRRSDTRARAWRFAPRSVATGRGTGDARRGAARRMQAWPPASSRPRRRVRRRKKNFDRRGPSARSAGRAGPASRRDYLTRRRTRRARAHARRHRWRPSCAPVNSGGRQQQQQPVVVSARQLRVPPRNSLFPLLSARTHTQTHARTIASSRHAVYIARLPRRPNPRGNSTDRLAAERRRPSVPSVFHLSIYLSRSLARSRRVSALPIRGVLNVTRRGPLPLGKHVGTSAGNSSRRAQEEDAADEGGDGEVQGRVRGVPEAAAGGSDAPRGSE